MKALMGAVGIFACAIALYIVFSNASLAFRQSNGPVSGPAQVSEQAVVAAPNVQGETINKTSFPEESNTTVKEKLDFPFTAEQFVSRYNTAMSNLKRNVVVKKETENDNGRHLTIQLAGNTHIGFVLTANNQNRRLQSFLFIGAGDGTLDSGVDIMMGIVACVMAIDNPDMSPNSRGEILKQLGVFNGGLSKSRKIEINRNGVTYSLTHDEQLGTLFIGGRE
jgi:hypothetical protein